MDRTDRCQRACSLRRRTPPFKAGWRKVSQMRLRRGQRKVGRENWSIGKKGVVIRDVCCLVSERERGPSKRTTGKWTWTE